MILPFISQWAAFKSATSEEKWNMTFYYQQARGLRQWSGSFAVGSRVLAPFYGPMYGDAQGTISTHFKYSFPLYQNALEMSTKYILTEVW